MAFANINPKNGKTGQTSVSVGCPAFTGRLAQQETHTFTTTIGSLSKVLTVKQNPKALYVTIGDDDTIPAGEQSITLQGSSNAALLAFNKNYGSNISNPVMKVNGTVQTNTGTATSPKYTITGDPGAKAEYTYEFTFTIAANTSASPLETEIEVIPDNTAVKAENCTITQQGAPSSISLDKETLTFEAAGGTQTVVVTSNSPWTAN